MFYHQLLNELWKLFGKKRTYLGFVMFLLAQNIILLVFRFSHATVFMRRILESNGYSMERYYSSLTYATGMVFPIAFLLVPLYAALVGGDLMAKESEDGTLRMILSRPISRLRLVYLKWLAGMIFAALLIFALGVFGLVFASIWFPWGGLFVFVPGELFSVFDSSTGWHRYLSAHFVLVLKSCTIVSLGLMFSCFNVKPAAATILALSFVYGNWIMQNIPYFQELKHWFFTYHLNVWQFLFVERVPWWRIGESVCILAGFSLTFLIIGAAVFQVRDIKT